MDVRNGQNEVRHAPDFRVEGQFEQEGFIMREGVSFDGKKL
jgi:hypothetical protein